MDILDYAAFGDIIKKWANGEQERPTTVGEFKAQVEPWIVDLGPGYADCDEVVCIDLPPMGKVSLVIPHPDDVNAPAPVDDWQLPEFYARIAFNNLAPNIRPEDREEFKSCRIADYGTGKCM